MKRFKIPYKISFLLLFLMCSMFAFSQNNKQAELEARRQELLKEIRINKQLQAESKSKEKSQLSLIEDFNYKINVLSNLIKVTNQQANLLTRGINNNQKKITSLREELKQLKNDYAAMIVKSYKSKNEQSRIMFLLSSDNFKQAYKRLQYIKQYSDHQREQGETIKAKTQELQKTNIDLQKQQEDKKQLISENRAVQKSLEQERKQHQSIMQSIKSNLSKYTAEIKKKQRESDRIDKQINDIIRAEIVKSNKKAGKSLSSKTFALTPEEKILSSSFTANKGKLPWPVEKGYVILRYGKQPSPIDKTLIINSNGVRISTEKGAKVKAVFNGVVSKIVLIKNANPMVMVRHGNYTSTYKNLSKISVKVGDKVVTNQEIGEVFTNRSNGETILSFSISKEADTQNPASWLYKM